MRARPVPAREAESQRRVAYARGLHRLAQRAGLVDFSARRAAELVVRSTIRANDTDVLSMLARQTASRWEDGLDDIGRMELAALVRAVRRAAARVGEDRRPAGRSRRGARAEVEWRSDTDVAEEWKARDLVAMSDGLEAIRGAEASLIATTIAETEVAPIETVDSPPVRPKLRAKSAR